MPMAPEGGVTTAKSVGVRRENLEERLNRHRTLPCHVDGVSVTGRRSLWIWRWWQQARNPRKPFRPARIQECAGGNGIRAKRLQRRSA